MLQIEGANKLGIISAKLKGADKTLRNELNRAIRRTAEPLREEIRKNLDILPSSGGLSATLIADTKIVTRRRKDSLRIQPQSRRRSVREQRRLERGRLGHPVYGNREVWVIQSVPPHWFTDPILDKVGAFRRDMIKVLDDVARRIGQ